MKDADEEIAKILDQEMLARATYTIAAIKILEELDARGFTVEDPLQAVGLQDKITNIILETVRGNANYCVATNEEPDGWEGDLPNQGPNE